MENWGSYGTRFKSRGEYFNYNFFSFHNFFCHFWCLKPKKLNWSRMFRKTKLLPLVTTQSEEKLKFLDFSVNIWMFPMKMCFMSSKISNILGKKWPTIGTSKTSPIWKKVTLLWVKPFQFLNIWYRDLEMFSYSEEIKPTKA